MRTTIVPGLGTAKLAAPQKDTSARLVPSQDRGFSAVLSKDGSSITGRVKEASESWIDALEECLSQIGRGFPGVSITVADYTEAELARAAQALGRGNHLVVSTDFLKNMASSEESFKQGKSLLEDLLSALSAGEDKGKGVFLTEDTVRFWTLSEEQEDSLNPWTRQSRDDERLLNLMQEAKKKAEETRKKFSVRVNPSSYSAVSSMARLARARTASDVKSVISSARRSIGSIKIAMSFSDDKTRNKLRAAIANMEKVASRGGKKIRELNEEFGVRSRQEKAEKEQLRRKAEMLRQELRQRRTARHSRESAQIHEVRDKEIMDRELERAQEALEQQLETLSGVSDTSPAAAEQVSADCGAAVQLSPPVEISPQIIAAI